MGLGRIQEIPDSGFELSVVQIPLHRRQESIQKLSLVLNFASSDLGETRVCVDVGTYLRVCLHEGLHEGLADGIHCIEGKLIRY